MRAAGNSVVMKKLFCLVLLAFCNMAYGQLNVVKSKYYSFTFGTINLDSLNIKESLTFKGELITYNSDKYSLIIFQNFTMRMELVGKDIPIEVDDTLFYDRKNNLLYLFKLDTGYYLYPWLANTPSWNADTATISNDGKTAYMKKSLPANVFPMPRVAMGVGVYRYASKQYFLNLEKYETTKFNFSPYIERVKHLPIATYDADIIY